MDRDRDVERLRALLSVTDEIMNALQLTGSQLVREVDHLLGDHFGESRAKIRALEAENAQLQEAVAHRAIIEQAKGILMARYGCDADQAFTMLGEQSRRERRKVRELAAVLVAGISRQTGDKTSDKTKGGDDDPDTAADVDHVGDARVVELSTVHHVARS